MQVEEVDYYYLKLIEFVQVNMVEIQGIWDEKGQILKNAVVVWRILPKGMFELKKRVLDDDVVNITKNGKHYPFWRKVTLEGM